MLMAKRETQPIGGPFGVSLEFLCDLCFDLFSRFLLLRENEHRTESTKAAKTYNILSG